MSSERTLVLAGAGHAHVEVFRRWERRPIPGVSLVLIVDRNPAIYSGMVPGFVAGQYRQDEIAIDGVGLAARAGGRVVLESVTRIDARRQQITCQRGTTVSYDIASLDLGSTVIGRDLRGAADHALPARPIEGLIAGVEDLIARARTGGSGEPFALVVVGGGAGGVELAFCFEARLRSETGRSARVTLLDQSEGLLPRSPPALANRVARAARRRGILFRGGARIVGVNGATLLLASGEKIEADASVWVLGPAAHGFLRSSGLPVDGRGFVRIEPTLQVEGNPTLYAVGDCAALPGMRKAGVYAVRAGPILDANLRSVLAAEPLRRYRPQPEFLSLLNLGDGTAIGVKRGLTFEGRWVMRLKDAIDRRFMGRYQ